VVPRTQTDDGSEVAPGSGVIPILKQIGPKRLLVVGTGFYVTRYGLFATARHVLEDLVAADSKELGVGYVLEDRDGKALVIRRIVGASLSNIADIALGQAENSREQKAAPSNRRGRLALSCPEVGESLATYAYPENDVLDFNFEDRPPTLKGDYFEGVFERQVLPSEHPFVPHPHYETSIPIRSGASGCPVFNSSGRIVAIACRGWDFRGAEHEGTELSAVIPVSYLLSLEGSCARIPKESWEYSQTPVPRRGVSLSFGELIAYGHIDFGVFRNPLAHDPTGGA